jgi:modification methylase
MKRNKNPKAEKMVIKKSRKILEKINLRSRSVKTKTMQISLDKKVTNVSSKNLQEKLSFPGDFKNKIICGDIIEILKQIPDGAIDLIITSPPYNLKNSTGNGMKDGRGGKWANAALKNGYTNHNDCMPHDEYVKWQRDCLTEMIRIIPEDGAIFYNHKWRVQGGLLQDRQDIVGGFPVRQIIIWRRKGGLNFNTGYFLPTYEVIYLIAKPKFKLRIKANAHGDVWEFTQEMNNEHPAAFPVALIDRIVASTDAKTILDPFMGSGTTAISAINFRRNYVGIDISPEYCVMAEKRIKKHISQGKLL